MYLKILPKIRQERKIIIVLSKFHCMQLCTIIKSYADRMSIAKKYGLRDHANLLLSKPITLITIVWHSLCLEKIIVLFCVYTDTDEDTSRTEEDNCGHSMEEIYRMNGEWSLPVGCYPIPIQCISHTDDFDFFLL